MKVNSELALIAEFMDLEFIDTSKSQQDYGWWTKGKFIDGKSAVSDYFICITDNGLGYKSSWNWLMPVVEKICRLRIGDGKKYTDFAYPRTFGMLNEEDGQIMVRLNGFILYQSDTLLESTYLAVVDFVKFHNSYKENIPYM